MKKQFFSKTFSIFLALSFVLSNSAMLVPLQAEACEEEICEDVIVVSNIEDKVFDIAETLPGEAAVLAWDDHPAWTAYIEGANWIWKTEYVENPDQDETYIFKKDFDIVGIPDSATLKVATDNSYSVWVNNVLIGEVITEDNHSSTTQDQYNNIVDFHTGSNEIKFEVKNWAGNASPKLNPAGLLYRLEIVRSSCEPQCIPQSSIETDCTNGLDDDCDGFIDSEDSDCQMLIMASKVICDNESDLPNWGTGSGVDYPSYNIDQNTASDYVAEHSGCYLASNWFFQWGQQGSDDFGKDFYGEAGNGYTTFGPTNENGVASTTVDSVTGSYLELREVLQQGYIPFTYDQSHKSNDNNISAEFYCHNDILNYDNWDYIKNPQLGITHYCVGFNALIEQEEPEPVCGNEIIETGEQCDPPSTTAPNSTDEYFCDQNCNLVPIYHSLDGCPKNQILEFIQSYQIHSTSTTEVIIPVSGSDTYKFEVKGTFYPTQNGKNENFLSDAAYTTEDGWVSTSTKYGIKGIPPDYAAHALLGDLGLGAGVINWGDYDSSHEYDFSYTIPSGATSTQFVIGDRWDNWFIPDDISWNNQGGMKDNLGNLTLDVYECKPIQARCDPKLELVMNGDFESPEVTDLVKKWGIFPSGTTDLEWLINWREIWPSAPKIANLEIQKSYYTPVIAPVVPGDPDQYAELDTDWHGPGGPSGEPASVAISQDIPTIIGETYRLSFDFSPRPYTDLEQNHLKGFVDSAELFDISADGSGLTDTLWNQYSDNFVATSSITNIKFTDYGTPDSLGTFLDNVSVRCVPQDEPTMYHCNEEWQCIADPEGEYNTDNCDNQCIKPGTSTVTICKYNEQEEPLRGWKMILKGDRYDTVPVFPDGQNYSSNPLLLGDYLIQASGQYLYRPGTPGAEYSDAGYTKRNCPGDADYLCSGDYTPWFNVFDIIGIHQGWLGIMVNDNLTDWGYFTSDHTYTLGYPGYSGSFTFTIKDDVYSDNSGSLTVKIYKGYVGETGEKGCVTFNGVPYGEYIVDEDLQSGWINQDGLGNVTVDDLEETFDVVNIPPEGQIGSLTVCKYRDHEPFGEYNTGIDTPLTWEMRIIGPNSYDQLYETDPQNGCKTINNLEYGQYVVSEELKIGWDQTYPLDPNTHTIDINGGNSNPSVYFLNYKTIDNGGTKYACNAEGQCIENEGGNYTTSNCDEECRPYPYTCNSSTSECVRDVHGQFGLLQGCEDACRVSTPLGGQYAILGTVLGAATEKEEEPCGLYLLEYIKLGGDNNPEEVKKLQYFLNEYLGINLEITGVYNQATYQEVMRFQLLLNDEILAPWVEVNCLPSSNIATGYVYRTTQWKINMIVCPELNLPVPNLYDETCKYISLYPGEGVVAGAATSTVGGTNGTTTTTSTTTPETIGDTTTTVPQDTGDEQSQNWIWVLIGLLVIGGAAYLVYQTRQV